MAMDGGGIRPVFVCGTGRSGTSVVARLLGWHREVTAIPFELRFHVASPGLLDVADGSAPPDPFVAKVWRRWYQGEMLSPSGTVKRSRGLASYFDRDELHEILDGFVFQAGDDPESAARHLMRTVLARAAARGTGRVVIEHSPANGRVADRLHRLLPEAEFVAVVRDGRDAAASIATKRFGPDDPLEALWLWAERHRETTARLGMLPADRVLTVDLLDLTGDESDATLDRLLAFIRVHDDPYVRAYLHDAMSRDAASVGRWRGLPAPLRGAIDTAYEAITAWCTSDGIPMPRPGS
jgi:hypothetical protein